MAVFKCKMCGGNLEIQEGMTVCECEYCGSIQTVPQLDDEKKINLFTRANRLRIDCEFDKAAGVYESIVTEFPEEAEAYWGLLLCKYGIEYVDDPKTGKKIPTCHRSSFDSIMDDPNFDMVMECSDPASRAVYRDEAKVIEALRIGIIEVSSKEEPYDIFICYKETDALGERTIDSVIAQDVYDALTEKGYRVFFSRITLEDKLGQEYEPYIFAALNSAPIMLAFGTDYEYYNAVWVKNEWSRFLSLIEKGEKKTLIPCFRDIDAYDMPKEFARLQAQDMGKVGAIQDLVRGIGKIIGEKEVVSAGNSYMSAVSANGSALVQRGNMALEDGDFAGAEGYFERALDVNPSDAYAYLGKFFAANGVSSLEDFEDKACWLEDNKEFKRAEQFADSQLSNQLKAFKESNTRNIERLRFTDTIKKIAEKKTMDECMQLISRGTDGGRNQAFELLDAISKYISTYKYQYYRAVVENRFGHLRCLKEERQKAAYDEACKKVDAQIQDEIASKTKIVLEEFDARLRDVQREIDKAIAENNRERDAIELQISDLRRQQSSLGFFKGKEKKALQVQIDKAQICLNVTLSQEQIQANYQPKIAQIHTEKQAEIDKITAQVQAKYPLPKLEDFAEV